MYSKCFSYTCNIQYVYIYTQVVIVHHAIPIEYMNTMLMLIYVNFCECDTNIM